MCFPCHLDPLYHEAKELCHQPEAWKTQLRLGMLFLAKYIRDRKETISEKGKAETSPNGIVLHTFSVLSDLCF